MTTTLPPSPPRTDAAPESLTAGEIAQQPRLWRALAASMAAGAGEHAAFLAPLLARDDLRVVLCGAGSSAFVGQILAPRLAGDLGRRVEALATTDVVSNPRQAFGQDVPTLMVSFARSGDSPESVEAVRLADALLSRVHHVVVTCSTEGALHREHSGREDSLVLLMPDGSNDRGFAMTSSFTCMLLAAATLLGGDPSVLGRLADALEAALPSLDERARDVAARGYRRVVYLGSGPLQGLARESALKILELTAGRVVSFFDSSLGFRHGPKAVVDARTLVVAYRANDPHARRYDDDIVAELCAPTSGADVLVVGAGGVADDHGTGGGSGADAWWVQGVDGVDDVALAAVLLAGAQLVALHSSLVLGLTPDDPFPSQEVNRVVRGVTLHPLEP